MSFKALHGPLLFRKIFNSRFHKNKLKLKLKLELPSILVGKEEKAKSSEYMGLLKPKQCLQCNHGRNQKSKKILTVSINIVNRGYMSKSLYNILFVCFGFFFFSFKFAFESLEFFFKI
jgi:hypothetical protein